MSETAPTLPALKPPVVDGNGFHFEPHGPAVFHTSRLLWTEERVTAAMVTVFSRADSKQDGVVLLHATRAPFELSLYLEPEAAETLAENLRRAAQQARAVRAVKERRKSQQGGQPEGQQEGKPGGKARRKAAGRVLLLQDAPAQGSPEEARA
jgi:uncharacterized protein (DUF2132 family)